MKILLTLVLPVIVLSTKQKFQSAHYFIQDPNSCLATAVTARNRSFTLDIDIYHPNISDASTIRSLIKMSWNAYLNAPNSEWKHLPCPNQPINYNSTTPGLRGQVFTNNDKSLIIVAFKGTTFTIKTGDQQAKLDQYMDNSLFSCCCAKVDRTWSPVCSCYHKNLNQQCSNSCLNSHMNDPQSYVSLAQNIVLYWLSVYPSATIWLTGHSLGGSLATLTTLSLLGSSFTKIYSIAFSSPPTLLPAKRLGLAEFMDPNRIVQIGLSSDPIFSGTCQGIMSTCYAMGYAMESKCHIGNVCSFYDNSYSDIRKHQLSYLLAKSYDNKRVTVCNVPINCTDCSGWSFIE